MHYLSHQTLDTDHGIILDVAVTPGDASDQEPYLAQMERVMEIVPVQAATADSIYDYGLFHKVLGDMGVDFFVRPMKQEIHRQTEFGREDFEYSKEQDIFLCPSGKHLSLSAVSRGSGTLQWVYSARRSDCQSCPMRERCLSQSVRNKAKRLVRSVFEDAAQRNLSRRSTPEYREALKKRQVWCEGTFSAQKWGHNLTRVLRRGREAAEDHCLLSATAMNLKRMIRCTG